MRRGMGLVVAVKAITALLLWCAFGLLLAAGRTNPNDFFSHLVRELFRGNPPGIVIRFVVERSRFLAGPALYRLAGASAAYALLETVEAAGLALQKRWAEWLTILVTGSLIPFEVFEIVREATAIKLGTVAVNAAILAYLIVRVVGESTRGNARRSGRESGHRPTSAPAPYP